MILEGERFSNNRNQAMKYLILLMEKEILYFTGRKRTYAKKKYLQLIRSSKDLSLDEPIFLKRK
jgi:hypothetical protein